MPRVEAKVIMDLAFPDDYSSFVMLDALDVKEILAALRHIQYMDDIDSPFFIDYQPNDNRINDIVKVLENLDSSEYKC